MECPHLCNSIKINRNFIKTKKCELTTGGGGGDAATESKIIADTAGVAAAGQSSSTTSANTNKQWRCLGKIIEINKNSCY